MVKTLMQISFSGGRTSAYMTKLLLDNLSDKYEFIVTFANTGMEHPKTLEFINKCDSLFKFKTVWLEAEVFSNERKSSGHKIVSFETASRKGEPYEAVIKKYGIPNTAFPQCTRELKVNPMRSYLKSLGISHQEIPTAIGIRKDETRRVSKQAQINNIIYPLIDIWPSDKQDVLDWWEEQEFDLEIEEFEGNCLGCYKKSYKKHFLQLQKDPSCYDFYDRMETLYSKVGPQKGERVFFRGNLNTKDLKLLYEEHKNSMNKKVFPINLYDNGGCSESCEVYDME